MLQESVTKYQDPAAADKIVAIQQDLDDTKAILVKTIDQVLERGEKIEDLMDKSNDLSNQSKRFYKTAKKHNECCTIL